MIGQNRFAPVRVGEELDVKIEAVGEKGDGIAKKNGFVLFVPATKAGDDVRIRVTRVLKKVGFAEVIGKAQGAPSTHADQGHTHHKTKESEEEVEIDESKDSEDFGDGDSNDAPSDAPEDNLDEDE